MTTSPILPKNFYMITNRAYQNGQFQKAVAAGGALTFLTAPAAPTTSFTIVDQSDWLTALQADLQANGSAAPACANIFVHGYGVSYDKATTVFPTYFTNIQTSQGGTGYPGVQIGFDWPSDDADVNQPTAFQNAKAIAQTTGQESFPLLLSVLQAIKTTGGVESVSLTAICHSMGNYTMCEGAGAFAPQNGAPPLFDQILCVAAMLENNGFNSQDSATYCADIVAAAGQVTIYYSTWDDVLPKAEKPKYDDYPELGIGGPISYQGLLTGAIGLDCSQVVTPANAQADAPYPHLTHTAYFYIPEVLQDLATALLSGQGGFPDRTPIAGSNNQGFTMVPD